MCNIIVINHGEKEIGTPLQFQRHFGFIPLKMDYYDKLHMDACLCQCDVEDSLKSRNIEFEKDCGDIYVSEQP